MNEMTLPPSRAATFGGRVKRFAALLVPGLEDIRRHEPIGPPLAAGSAAALAAAFAARPLVASAMRSAQPGTESVAEAMLLLLALAAPLLMLVKAGLLTSVGWAVLTLANSARRARLIFSTLLYGEALLAFQGVVAALLLHIRAGGSTASLQDLQVPLGLGALVSPTQPVLWALAQQATVFQLVWFVFVTAAMRRCAGLGTGASLALAALFWAAAASFAGARALLAP